MARLKQLEPKKETIGGLNFYIRPFPAMVAANLTGDLASLLTPVLAALMPLVGDSDNEGDDEDGDLMDIDVNDAAASISKSMEGFSGSKVESMMKKLLITHKNVVVELPVMDEDDVETGEYSQEILDMDIVNEIFCGDVQDMFILAFYVIRLNFNGFFKRLAGPSGKAGEAIAKKMRKILPFAGIMRGKCERDTSTARQGMPRNRERI